MNNDELMHYGRKGMKWGVRRNKVTTAGLNAAKNVSDSSRSGVDAIRNTISSVHRSKKGSIGREQARTMTDAELKKKIARLNLEQQYSNLSANNISKGRANLDSVLTIAGGVLATTSSALGVALAIKQLKG